MLIVTICSTKGGVGKTTTTANLAGFLADNDYKVLLVDGDIQPTLSSYFPLAQRAPKGLFSLITQGFSEDCISKTSLENIDIIISDDPEGALENFILHTPDGRVRLKHSLSQLKHYDFILIDTQGAAGPLQDVGVLAADLLLSPIPPEILSAREFSRGTLSMIERLKPMQYLGAPVGPLYGLIYKMDRTIDARVIAETLRKSTFAESKGGISILETVIPNLVAFREGATAQVPVHKLGEKTYEVIEQLAVELFPHIELANPLKQQLERGKQDEK